MNPRPRRPAISAASNSGPWSSRTSTSASVKAATAATVSSRSATCPRRPAEQRGLVGERGPDRARPDDQHRRHRHPQVEQEVLGALGDGGAAAQAGAGGLGGCGVPLVAAEAPGGVGQLGAGEHQRGGAVEGGDERRGGAAFERRAQRLGAGGGQRVAEQRGAAAAGQARGEGGGLGDVGVAGLRACDGGGDQRDGRRVQRAAVEHARDRAARGAREHLPALDGAEAVAVEHPHDPHAVARERAQRRPQPP